jgi:hypothetical protein
MGAEGGVRHPYLYRHSALVEYNILEEKTLEGSTNYAEK